MLSHIAAAALGGVPTAAPVRLRYCWPAFRWRTTTSPLVALADPGVLTALRPTDPLLAAGPGWDGATVPDHVRRVGDLSGALQIVDEALGPRVPGTRGRRRSTTRR